MITKEDSLKYSRDILILYVEDDTFLAKSNCRILSQFYDKIDLAANGAQGLKLYQQNGYDIIITDLLMPELP